MKFRLVFLSVFQLPFASVAQPDLLPDYFTNFESLTTIPKEVSIAVGKRSCFICRPQTLDIHFLDYQFNESGQVETRYAYFDAKRCGKQVFNYGILYLESYENRSTLVSTGIAEEMVWDSTILTHSIVYEYDSVYGIFLTNLKWFDGNDRRLNFEINYEYDNTGGLTETEIIHYPDLTSLGQFEPNTSKWITNPDEKRFSVNRKKHEIVNDGVLIRWFKEDTLTAIESITLLSNWDYKSVLKDVADNVLWEITKIYDSQDQRPLELHKVETGYDGFGDPYDFPSYNRVTFHYDEKRNLILKRYFHGDTLESEERFEYLK